MKRLVGWGGWGRREGMKLEGRWGDGEHGRTDLVHEIDGRRGERGECERGEEKLAEKMSSMVLTF